MHTRISLTLMVFLLGACATPKVPLYDGDQHVQQCTSLLGKPLYPPPLSPNILVDRTAQLRASRHDFDADPRSLDHIIWLGRRQAYLGRYDLAMITYTQGLEAHRNNAKLLRHRGHRYITLRQFDKAIADLELAAERTGGSPDEVEPDGQPNEKNVPLSTLQTNIYYHLGLARYLTGDYEKALLDFDACLHRSKNEDMKVASLYWTYLTLTRLGRTAEARRRIEPAHENTQVIENQDYLDLLLLFKGDKGVGDFSTEPGTVASSTVQYGIANWHMLEGDRAAGRDLLRQITEEAMWPAFGHVAAEADVKLGM